MKTEGLKIVVAHELTRDSVRKIANSLTKAGALIHISKIIFPYDGPGFPGHRKELDWEDQNPDVVIFATPAGGDGTLWLKEREYLSRVIEHLEKLGSGALLIMATSLPSSSRRSFYKGRTVYTTLEAFLEGSGGQFIQNLQGILI